MVLTTLQGSQPVLDLVNDGSTYILSTGDMTVEEIHESEQLRQSTGGSLVLGVSVQDAGEIPLKGPLYRQTVIVRALDRLNGFGAIRNVRFAIIDALDSIGGVLNSEGGAITVQYAGRTGHKVDKVYNVDFESITFVATVERRL